MNDLSNGLIVQGAARWGSFLCSGGVFLVLIQTWVFGVLIGIVGLGFTGMGFFYARIKNAEQLAQERGIIATKLDNIDKKVEGIIISQTSQQSLCSVRGERIAVVERDVKSAHNRIDGIERRLQEHE